MTAAAHTLGPFAEGFMCFRRVLSNVDQPNRWILFQNIAAEAATYLVKGLDRATAADELTDIAEANGLMAHGIDAVQHVIADAFEAAADRVPPLGDDGPAWERDEQPTPKGNGRANALPFIDMSTWDSTPTPARQWYVLDHIPSRQPTLISGEGSIGKSILLLQLLVATSLSQLWIGCLGPRPGPTIYFGAEDEQDEIRRRLAAILDYHGARFADLIAGGFKFLAYAGKDAVLAEFDRSGRIRPTALFGDLYAEAVALRPSAVVIDTVSDVFLGDEIKREQVRQFGSLMRKLAIDADTAAIMSAHPSLSGMKSGSGLSGSTQWHNTVRARIYFRKPDNEEDDEGSADETKPDDGRRELRFLKNQFGPLGRRIPLRWSKGLWLPPANPSEDAKAAAAAQMNDLFLELLRRFTAQGRNVSDKQGPSYAPAKFAQTPEAKKMRASSRTLAAAMERLLANGKIMVIAEGPPSRRISRLVEVA
jgi:RecA-family ATPase